MTVCLPMPWSTVGGLPTFCVSAGRSVLPISSCLHALTGNLLNYCQPFAWPNSQNQCHILGSTVGALFFCISNSFFIFSSCCFMGLWAVFKFYFSFSLLCNKPLKTLLVQTTSTYVDEPHSITTFFLDQGGCGCPAVPWGGEGEPDYSTPWVLPLSVSVMQYGGGASAPHWDL